MKQFLRDGGIGKLREALQPLVNLHIPMRAAYAGYFIVLSVFPALLLALACIRFAGLRVELLVGVLSDVVPQALMGTVRELVMNAYRSASGTIAGVSAVTALWSASKGVYGLLTGLNAVYGVSEDRGYFYTRAISVVYSLVLLAVLLLTLVLHVFGAGLTDFLLGLNIPALSLVVDILSLRIFFLTAVQTLLFTAMFMVLPNRRNGFWASLPGGLLTSIGWMVFSDLFSIYVTHFSSYANIFGSVYAIALGMLWLYCCISILLYGGALNRYLAAEKNK